MAVLFVNGSSNSSNGSDLSGTINPPTGIVPGDLLVVVIAVGSGTSVTTLSGWTIIGSAQTGTNLKQQAYYRLATTADMGNPTYTWTFTGSTTAWTIAMVAYRGMIQTSSVLDANGVGTATTAQAVNTPTITSGDTRCLLVAMRTTRDDVATTSNVQNTTSASGWSAVRAEATWTIASPAKAAGSTIWDNLPGGLVAPGSQTGISTSCGTTTPTESIVRSISFAANEQGGLQVNQAVARGAFI